MERRGATDVRDTRLPNASGGAIAGGDGESGVSCLGSSGFWGDIVVDYVQEAASAPSASRAGVRPRKGNEDRRRLAERSLYTVRVGADERFVKLRRRFAAVVSILAAVFLGWYLCYLYLAAYEREFMSIKVLGSINVALLFGIGQFATTFVFAWVFARYAKRCVDPLADDLHAESDNQDTARRGRVVQP